jgi:hypothetical protein
MHPNHLRIHHYPLPHLRHRNRCVCRLPSFPAGSDWELELTVWALANAVDFVVVL